MKAQEPLRFGPFTLDPVTLELWRDGARIALEPLPARILWRLAEEAGSMLGRPELLALGWSNAPAVTNQSLNTCIHQIRQALDHGGPAPVRLETLRGRGYRLIVDDAARHAPAKRRPSLRSNRLSWIAAALAIVTTVVVARAVRRDIPPAAQHDLQRARYLVEETEDYAGARALLDSARRRFPSVAALHAEWAEVSALSGALDDARRGAAEALRLDRRQVTAYRTRGMLALLQSDWSAADTALEQAYQLDTRDTRTLSALAFRRAIDGRFSDSNRLMREALEIDPLSAVLYRDAGLLYLIAGRYGDAEHYCREALRYKPNSVWATDCLFDVAVLARQTDSAALWGRRLLRAYGAAAPPEPISAVATVAATEAWRLDAWIRAVDRGANPFGLALAYAANGRLDDAISALRSAAAKPSFGVLTIAVDPRLAALRGRAGFDQLLTALKLPRPRTALGADIELMSS